MNEVPLTQGFVAFVDDEDFERVMQVKWHANITHDNNNIVYAAHKIKFTSSCGIISNKTELLGNFILNTDSTINYRDANRLNNCRNNLYIGSRFLSAASRSMNIRNTSGFRGVSWDKQHQKWRVIIMCNYKSIKLGRYTCRQCAASVYNKAAKQYFGEFAFQNEIKNHACGKFGKAI